VNVQAHQGALALLQYVQIFQAENFLGFEPGIDAASRHIVRISVEHDLGRQ
jgi:hypothetical protein